MWLYSYHSEDCEQLSIRYVVRRHVLLHTMVGSGIWLGPLTRHIGPRAGARPHAALALGDGHQGPRSRWEEVAHHAGRLAGITRLEAASEHHALDQQCHEQAGTGRGTWNLSIRALETA